MFQEKSSTSSQTVVYQITPTVSKTCKTQPSTETEETPLRSFNIVTSQTAHVKCNNHPPKPTPPKPTPYKPTPTNQPPTNQPPTNQLPTNPIPSTSGDGGQTQNKGGAHSGDEGQTQNKGGAQCGDREQTQNKGGAQGGDGGQTQNKGGAQHGDGGQAQKNAVPKVGMGEIPMVPFEQPPQRNEKFEQDRKRCSTDTDGKNPHENKRVHRDACVSDLVWPICKIDNTEYSKRFNIQILEAMTIFHQGMARLIVWVQIVNYKDIILLL